MIISNTPSPIFLHGTLIFSYIICQKNLNNDNGAGIFSINLKCYHNHKPTKSSCISSPSLTQTNQKIITILAQAKSNWFNPTRETFDDKHGTDLLVS